MVGDRERERRALWRRTSRRLEAARVKREQKEALAALARFEVAMIEAERRTGRDAVRHAVVAASNLFFARTGEVSRAISNLVLALDDADVGLVHPLVEPAPTGSQARIPTEEANRRALMVAVLRSLVELAGMKKRAAARAIVGFIASTPWGKTGRGDVVTAEMILDWERRPPAYLDARTISVYRDYVEEHGDPENRIFSFLALLITSQKLGN